MKAVRILSATLFIVLFLCSCAVSTNDSNNTGATTTVSVIQTPTPQGTVATQQEPSKAGEDQIRLSMAGMSDEDKIGQLLIFGFDGTVLDEQALAVIDRYKPGGLIVMGGNVKSSTQLLELVNSMKASVSKNGIPAFISVDEEGGRISRMPPELLDMPSAQTIGNTVDTRLASTAGNVTAAELKAFGFNMDFAPVLDIWSNPKNTVIGDRAFGSDAETAGRFGTQFMKGIASAGVIPVVKHFPGHGDTTADSHKVLPVSDSSIQRLESFELKPFEQAIDNGADVVMVAHILLKKVDDKYPSSLSKKLITDILRRQMGFGGVVITDDMTMAAITKNYGIAQAAVMSFKAGSDLILVCHGYENEALVAEALINALANGEISQDRLDESVYRILKLKEKYRIKDVPVNAVDIEGLNSEIQKFIKRIEEH